MSLLLALVAVGAACPAEDLPPEGGSAESGEATMGSESTGLGQSTGEPSTDESSSSGAGDSTGGVVPACECVAEADEFIDLVCEFDEICDTVEVACAQEPLADCELAELTVVNPEVLGCYHDALVAGTPALLRWELPYGPDPGVQGQRHLLVITEDRQAFTWHEAWGPPTYAFSAVTISELRAAEHFDGCMALPSPEEVFRCLFDAEEEQLGVCIPEHEFQFG